MFTLFLLLFSLPLSANINHPKKIDQAFNKGSPVCFLVKRLSDNKLFSHNSHLCRRKFPPFSTYKILHSLIALETGVIDGKKTVIAWDGKKKFIKTWERDHNIVSAIKHSVVPFYQEVARRIGNKRMMIHLKKVGYGNQEIGKKIDRFWLDGPLAISAYEQLDFVEKLYRNKLPFSLKNQKFVQDILVLSQNQSRILSGKTGSQYRDGSFQFGWLVGHIRQKNEEYVFVINSKGKGQAGHKLKKVVLAIFDQLDFQKLVNKK